MFLHVVGCIVDMSPNHHQDATFVLLGAQHPRAREGEKVRAPREWRQRQRAFTVECMVNDTCKVPGEHNLPKLVRCCDGVTSVARGSHEAHHIVRRKPGEHMLQHVIGQGEQPSHPFHARRCRVEFVWTALRNTDTAAAPQHIFSSTHGRLATDGNGLVFVVWFLCVTRMAPHKNCIAAPACALPFHRWRSSLAIG